MKIRSIFRRLFCAAAAFCMTLTVLPVQTYAEAANSVLSADGRTMYTRSGPIAVGSRAPGYENKTSQFANSGSGYAAAYAHAKDNWQAMCESRKDNPPVQIDKNVESVMSTLTEYYVKDTIQAVCTLVDKKIANAYILKNIIPEMKNARKAANALNPLIRSLSDPKNWSPDNLRKIKELTKIRDAQWLRYANLKDAKLTLKNSAGRLIGGVFALYGFYDMITRPKVGYNNALFEFGALTLRGFSNAASLVFPPAALPLGITETILTCDAFVNLVNSTEKLAKDNIPGADTVLKGMNWLGGVPDWIVQKGWEWNPLWILYYDVPRWYTDAETGLKLLWARKKYEEEHGKPFSVKKAEGATPAASGIGVYKPNIYLYPEEETAFSVRFGTPELLTVTDPLYEGIWQGSALPDGTLTVGENTYGFLFYESVTEPWLYQCEEGFVIPADDRAAAFTRILTAYGLNEQEIADFNAFWCGKLESGCDYAMYPQLTQTVDAAMPVTISPQPDTVFRIWFAFVRDDTPQREAVPEALTRDGFTAVEWGGFFLN